MWPEVTLLENPHAEPGPTTLTGVVPEIVFVLPSFLFVHVIDRVTEAEKDLTMLR